MEAKVNKLTDQEAERLLEYYWAIISLLNAEQDIHVYATYSAFADDLAEILDKYLENN